MKNIFVGNLSFGATEGAIRSLFEQYGQVDRVSVVTDRDTGQSRGFGFVEMPNNAEGDQAATECPTGTAGSSASREGRPHAGASYDAQRLPQGVQRSNRLDLGHW